ncbi:hypothetical protein CUBA_gp17c [Staphylococcus phage CUB-A]|nr:hypothetical protein CUBA_gp17c [Staphylococcus phage CUB-A]WPH66938.1 hypothetical protein CUBB_gp22c [Staphylococcus phage CUB-B]
MKSLYFTYLPGVEKVYGNVIILFSVTSNPE